MFKFLAQIVSTQSGTRNKKGVDEVGKLIKSSLKKTGLVFETHTQEDLGDHLVAKSFNIETSNTQYQKGQILITGHMDTVFPKDTDFNFYKEDDIRCYGPGVIDMKGGLVVGIYALKALHAARLLNDIPLKFIFNSDEEIGSPTSKDLIKQEAKKSRVAFVLEAGGLANEIVTGRKGNISISLTVKGKAGHAAFAKKEKSSAILELSHKIIAIEQLNDPVIGISANVGKIFGGIGPNTIPEKAEAIIDFRFLDPKDQAQLHTRIRKIASSQTIPGTESFVKLISTRPAMPQSAANKALFLKVKQIAQYMNIQLKSELRQGVSDANIIADTGTPVLDGLGPIGAKDHSEDEYMEKSSFLERTILFAEVLYAMFSEGQKKPN